MADRKLLPARFRLPRDLPRQDQREALKKFFGTGRPSALRLDVYADAAGKDDWDSADAPWYVVAVVATRQDGAWRAWRARYEGEYNNEFHLGSRAWFEANGGEAARTRHLSQLIELRPWQYAHVTIANRDAVRRAIDLMQVNPVPGGAPAPMLWATGLSAVVSYLREVVRLGEGSKAAARVVRRVVCNNMAQQAAGEWNAELVQHYGDVCPTYSSGTGNPGIAIADGLAWGFRSTLRYHPEQVLPWRPEETIGSRVQLSVLTDKPQPVTCISLTEVRRALGLRP